MDLQTLIVLAIVGWAAWMVFNRFFRRNRSSCGCGSSCDCGSSDSRGCQSAPSDLSRSAASACGCDGRRQPPACPRS